MALSKVNYNSLNVTPSASKFLAWDSDADALATADIGGSLNLISTQTASSSAALSFASNIDSTYKEYVFKIINCHPSASNPAFQVNFRDGSTDYDATKTTTKFEAYHTESGTATSFLYATGDDLAQATGAQRISIVGNENDQSVCGTLHLFDPSSTTFVKHFISRTQAYYKGSSAFCWSEFAAGYCNTTTAIDGVQFSFSSGNIDSGVIKMYGIS
tara:strand:- start:1673 stop:2317 length:645 start_codon:yes stop_codon:yes gene_type:complete